MINLRIRTEYSFGVAYGPLPKVLEAVGDAPSIAITDRHGTWGHVAFQKACKKAGKNPIFGVELAVVSELLQERMPVNYMAFLARTNAGLQEIYELVTESTKPENFYMTPRISYKMAGAVSKEVIVLSGTNPRWDLLNKKQKGLLVELAPSSSLAALQFANDNRLTPVATSDNYYPRMEHRQIYEIVAGRMRDSRTTAMHIMDEYEWEMYWPKNKINIGAHLATYSFANECNAVIPTAQMVKYKSAKTLEQMCREAAPSRRVNLKDPAYSSRLKRELDLIKEKEFEDYFFVIADMLRYAKKHMLVGPARGSSCGSLVCYLLSITEIDPIPYSLLFERFIDVNRKDLPDIDIDFPDDRRDMVFDYVKNKYGDSCVARLGTILTYQAKSSIDAVAISLRIPKGETDDLKSSIIERSTGDARAALCILDTFNDLDLGRRMVAKYPHLRLAADIEGHAKTTGQHAAGIVITQEPISKFCSRSWRTGAVMVDKYDAESINLLKIDALGLRTLSVLQDCLNQIGQSREWLLALPTDDSDAFEVINNSRFAGIFQFEGYALQTLAQVMRTENFEDIAALGALARPGPLTSGGATEFIQRRTGQKKVQYLHPMCEEMTRVTYGVVIYQEQVMEIARNMGALSWEDVSSLRKAMSKSFGQEYFDQFWVRFLEGAQKQGVSEADALHVWKNINTMGSWSFNRSHAVAYGMVTYWCIYLKAHHPLEFAVACLRHASDADQTIQLLRELDTEGFKYKAFDIELSEKNWTVKNGLLIGGLLNLKGVGDKKANDILERRRSGAALPAGMLKLLANAITPFAYDKVFEVRSRFSDIVADQAKYGINSKIQNLGSITGDMQGEFVFFGKIVERDLRDLNEPFFLQKRGGKQETGQTMFLNMTVEDDTGSIRVMINKDDYLFLGKPIVDTAKMGDWYIWKGYMRRGFRKVYIKQCWPERVFSVPYAERARRKAEGPRIDEWVGEIKTISSTDSTT